MPKRPLSVTLISALYLVAGSVGLAYHATELSVRAPLKNDTLLVCFIRLLAIIGGIGALRGRNWARWLLVLWIALHVVLSAFHSLGQTFAHAVFLALTAYCLFRPPAVNYFRAKHATGAKLTA